jgi:hypothetical protein
MSSVVLNGATSGSTTITPTDAVTVTCTLPSTGGTLQTSGSGYTTNGVAYASSTSALTTGSGLVFTGTNLGIGTSSPSQALDVNGSIVVRDNYYRVSSSGTITTYIGPGSALSGTTNDTAIRNDTGNILFGFSGLEKMRLTSAGYLGIGTSSPNTILHIFKSDGATADLARFQQNNQGNLLIQSQQGGQSIGGANGILFQNAVGSMGWQTNTTSGNAQMVLDSSGNLYVGATTGSARFYAYAADGGNVFGVGGTTKGVRISTNSTNTQITGVDTTLSATYQPLAIGGSYVTLNYNGNNEAARIDSSGNLLVGTTSANGYKLNVQAGGSGAVTCFDLGAGNIDIVGGSLASNVGYIGMGGSHSLAFTRSGTTESMRIDSSGNLLIGTTSLGTTNAYFQNLSGSRTSLNLGSSVTTSANLVFFNNPNGTVGTISTNGTATAYNTSSDYRLKENVQNMTGALAKVNQLRPVTYDWIADKSQGQGFIAHELQVVVPDCVTGAKDAVDAEGKPIYQGVDTSFLVATLTSAIQELNTLVTTQAETITSMQATITALQTKVGV